MASFGLHAALALLAVVGSVAPASAQDFVVTLLGTGSPTPAMDRFGPSTLVQVNGQTLVFDVGRGAHQRLNQLGIDAAKVDAVFLTHLHSDHIVGIPDLWLTGWLITRRARPWNVFGPAGTAAMMGNLERAFSVDLKVRVEENAPLQPVEGGKIAARDVEPGIVYDRDGVRVTAIKVDHRAIAPALGYRIDFAGRSVVLSGDTQISEDLIKAAMGTDLLVHEVYQAIDEAVKSNPRLSTVQTFHVDAAQAGTVFRRARPKLAVYSHIVLRGVDVAEVVRRTRSTYAGPLIVGEDLMRFSIGEDIAVFGP